MSFSTLALLSSCESVSVTPSSPSLTNSWYMAACSGVSSQKRSELILSGRSAMTLLSVLSLLRMKGAVTLLSRFTASASRFLSMG